MGQEKLTEEIARLERQLQDEKFLSNAPATAVEKVRVRLAKLQAQYVPTYENSVVDEGEWGFRWERLWVDEVYVTYPDFDDGGKNRPGKFGRSFTWRDPQDCDRFWAHLNQFSVHPDSMVRAIWERERREEEEAEWKLYLRLKDKFKERDAKPDSTETRPVE
jgi:Valyl tRNA synthetase tRNA binding arm